MPIRKPYIIHSFLFAIYPILYLYSKNIEQLSFYVTLLPSAIIILVVLVFLRLGKMFFGDDQKAAIAASVFFIWLFSYSAVRSLMVFEAGGVKLHTHRYFMIIWALVFLVFFLIILKSHSRFKNLSKYLNGVASLLILFTFFSVVSHQYSKTLLTPEVTKIKESNSIDILSQPDSLPKPDTLPDIYYIILDTYTGHESLKQYLDFDNSKFIQYLREIGFFVPDKSYSNYAWTDLSLASSLNMDYLRTASTKNTKVAIPLDDSVSGYEMVVYNKVVPFLESKGYKFIERTFWGRSISHKDIRVPKLISNNFNLALLKMTILDRPLVENYLMAKVKRNQVLKRFNDLRKVPDIKGPKFVYAHFLIPHHPYVFDKDGNMTFSTVTHIGYSEKDQYIGQLLYANKEIEKTIKTILSKSEVKPIIVIQGDHGVYGSPTLSSKLVDGDLSSQKLRMSILNAYHLPSTCKSLLYDGITPVNTFRIIFNSCFGSDYEVLPDKTFFSKNEEKRHLINITEHVQE